MVGAVLRPSGSLRICSGGTAGRSRRTASASASVVQTQTDSGGIAGASRSIVSRSSVRSPSRARSCLGRDLRDRGQKRVPLPPARISACTRPAPATIFLSFRSWPREYTRAALPPCPPRGACPGFSFGRHYGKDGPPFVVTIDLLSGRNE